MSSTSGAHKRVYSAFKEDDDEDEITDKINLNTNL